jgi:Fic family protein
MSKKIRKIASKKSPQVERASLMEPMLPEESCSRELEDLAIDLVAKANSLASKISPKLRESVANLVRSMNCYYSNLIEGHNTHPRDIEKALEDNFSNDKEKRNLQLEAKAHIFVQKMIDEGNFWQIDNIVSKEFIAKIHEEFYKLLPEELRQIRNPDTTRTIKVKPGKFRDGDVVVGRHIALLGKNLNLFLDRFEEAYAIPKLSRLRQIIAVAASHHRLVWIHPFYDGNGRVARLFSHSFLKYIGIGSGLWSISRALARQSSRYQSLLQAADEPRQGDLDGRGSLSHRGLVNFCKFFLEVCIDQIDYMSSILEPQDLLRRIELYTEDEIRAGRLAKGSFSLLREAVFRGEFERGRAAQITGYKSRQASTVVSELCSKGLLISDTPKGPLRLGFPVYVLERWFPQLYPYDRIH